MSNIILFLKKYKLELMVIIVLLSIPFIEPIFEVLIKCLFSVGTYVGTWIRKISEGILCS